MKQKNKIHKKQLKENLITKTNKKDNNSNLYEQSYERLFYELKNFKNKYYKKESNKSFKTLYFTKYVESLGYTLNLPNINFIWANHIFQSAFLSDLENYSDYEQSIQHILKILCGDFDKCIKIQKMQNFFEIMKKKLGFI